MLIRKTISFILWIIATIITVALYFVMLACSVVFFTDRKRTIAHAQCYWWSTLLLASNPYWKLRVTGREHIDRHATYVIIANHQSMADIAVLYQLKMQFKWVAKASLFKVPFIGWNLSLAKHIKLERGDFSSIKQIYRDAARWLRDSMSVLLFPEGTRSETGEMREFQNGAFKLAIKEKRPILPVLVTGTRDVISKGSWVFNPKTYCTVQVLPPVDVSTYGPADFEKLKDMVRNQLLAAQAATRINA